VDAWRAAGLPQTERGWLKVDRLTLDVQPGVFGAGDVTGLGGFTHLRYYHGQIVARRSRGMDARADHTAVPRVTYTDTEIASVRMADAGARARGIDVVVAAADPAETARGYIHDFHRGALKLVGDRQRITSIARADVPATVQQSIEFTSACCASSRRKQSRCLAL
jgi:pyruvate/2-oxoglutarate dehydrogenase complex dihydrolipoamide dehydrogenase (E3) component